MNDPCNCQSEYNQQCRRAGHLMTMREWELCANKCPAERPCHEKASEQVRGEWDRRAAAVAAGQAPFPKMSTRNIEPPGLGDNLHSLLSAIGVTPARVEEWVGKPCGCKERREKLNAIGRWFTSAAAAGRPAALGRLKAITGLGPDASK